MTTMRALVHRIRRVGGPSKRIRRIGGPLKWIGASGKRIAVTIVGSVLVVGGVALLVLPGPGLLVVAAGLAVLATEYAWARRALDETKRRAQGAARRVAGKHSPESPRDGAQA